MWAIISVIAAMLFTTMDVHAGPLRIELAPDPANPAAPKMGDKLTFTSDIYNEGVAPISGIVAWLGLLQVDKGKAQPIDLEDWSAQKAMEAGILGAYETANATWTIRLIQAGRYRVAVLASTLGSGALAASSFVDFDVAVKPVVASERVLPIALGIPGLLGGFIGWRWWRGREYRPVLPQWVGGGGRRSDE